MCLKARMFIRCFYLKNEVYNNILLIFFTCIVSPKLCALQKFWNFVSCKMFDLRQFKIAKINFILTQVSVKSLM